MKVLCSACEAAEAAVLCCADEAALCAACDRAVHAANRLAGKHQRLTLLPPAGGAGAPVCDICQDSTGYFFCLQDRAVLCRNCDISVHTANEYVTAHTRFLLTGVTVGTELTEQIASDQNVAPIAQLESPSGSVKKTRSMSLCGEDVDQGGWAGSLPEKKNLFNGVGDVTVPGSMLNWSVSNGSHNLHPIFSDPSKSQTKRARKGLLPAGSLQQLPTAAGQSAVTTYKVTPSGGFSDRLPDWPLDEIFGFSEYGNGFEFNEHGSSKADSGKFGSTDGSLQYRSAEEDPDGNEFLGQVPDLLWKEISEIPSPPTASGLHWQKNRRHREPDYEQDSAAFVPDISSVPDLYSGFATPARAKRHRRC